MNSRPTREQLARGQRRDCVRCGRHAHVAAWWPDGTICRTCCDRALRIRGRCPGCGDGDRVLPGLAPESRDPICTDCARFTTTNYRCSRCGCEGKLHAGRLCSRCTFADKLTELLGDSTGRIRPELVPLAEHLLAMNKPLSGLTWLYPRGRDRTSADLLRELGQGRIELTHQAFHTLEPWRAAEHLRELLMACGVLPAVDKQICGFERWLIGHLATITDPDHAQVVRRFTIWHILPSLRSKAERKPISPGSRRYANDQVKHATLFLDWLAARGLTLVTCRQADIDAWHVGRSDHHRGCLRGFLLWCMNGKLTRRFSLPTTVPRRASPMPPRERIELVGTVLIDQDKPLRSRAAALIVLLYAQPLTRVVRLTIDDVIRDSDQVLLRLGEPPSPVPDPVAEILLAWIGQRTNMNTATNRDSRWLFPGRRAGQPMHPETLGALVKAIGIPTVPARTAAIRQHVLQMPAPVVADALGYHHVTTTKLVTEVAATWSRYVTAPRFRSPTGWEPSGSGDS